MGLGGYPTVTLAAAREVALAAARMRRTGADPLFAKRQAAAEALAKMAAEETALGNTFTAVAEAYIASHKQGWKNAKHADQWTASLEAYAYPKIGTTAVSAITVDDIMGILNPIWATKTETASRVRGRIESILGYATVMKLRTGSNPARWKDNLDHLLPARSKVARVEHFAALPWQLVPLAMSNLARSNGMSDLCLRFIVLTAARSGEGRGARWEEINIADKVWAVPGERMKMGEAHSVPLSPAALAVLKSTLPPGLAWPKAGLIFPGGRKGAQLSDVAVSRALDSAAGEGFTVHGMRSSFRDWAAEKTDFPREICEAALAHAVGGVEGAYLRTKHFDKRRALMEAWAGYVAP
jgi:integrase